MDGAVLQTELDRYVIVEHLAEGGMGAIYLGKKIGVGDSEKEVVLKQLLPEFTSQPQFIGLFLREAKLSAVLDHVNIVRTIDLVAAGSDYFIVMEYVCGADLRTILRRLKRQHRALSVGACLLIAREILSALCYAHAASDAQGNPLQLIHRDISPSNIMLSAAGEVKLADFGIAKVSTHKSVFYRVRGKAGYMSPEQAQGNRPIDHRSDLFSLGVCLYEMLAAERLYVVDLMSTTNQIYSQEIPEIEKSGGSMPNGIDAVLHKALAVNPEQRFQTAAEFQEAIVQVAYDNEVLYTTADLARELEVQCGPDATRWRRQDREEAEPPPTEVFSGSESASAFSGVELSSILERTRSTTDQADRGLNDVAGTIETSSVASTVNNIRSEVVFRPLLRGSLQFHDALTQPPGIVRRDDAAQPRQDNSASRVLFPSAEWDGTTEKLIAQPSTAAGAPARQPLSSPSETGPQPRVLTTTEPGSSTIRIPPPGSVLSSPPTPMETKTSWVYEATGASQSTGRRTTTRTRVTVNRPYLAMVAAAAVLFAASAVIATIGIIGPSHLGVRFSKRDPRKPSRRGITDTKPVATALPRTLRVTSQPQGATVLVGEVHRCDTPCTLALHPGPVETLTIVQPGYERWSMLLDPATAKLRTIKARLKKARTDRRVGHLLIRASPAADIWVNGRPLRRVTSEGAIPLSPGRYRIGLAHPRKQHRVYFTAVVQAGETREVTKRL